MKEKLRTIYNRCQYALLGAGASLRKDVHFFPDANGWGITYRSGSWVYKRWGLPFLFHTPSFAQFLALHTALRERGVTEYLPPYEVGKSFVRYAYLPDGVHLVDALTGAGGSRRIALVAQAMRMTDYFHAHGLTHGDLKPKNILVQGDRLYALDLENAEFAPAADRPVDYAKLFPRIAYFCSEPELRSALEAAEASTALREYFDRRFFAKHDMRRLLAAMPGLRFETPHDTEGEDIDVYLPDAFQIPKLLGLLAEAELDYRLFYHALDDVKVFAYNAASLYEIDLHLTNPLSHRMFRQGRLRHPAAQIAIMGPDGVGKTTLVDRLTRAPEDPLLARLRAHSLHAWRFSREAPESPLTARLDRWTGGVWSRIPAYARTLRRNTAPLLYLDRSFYDPFLRGGAVRFAFLSIFEPFFPRALDFILLVAPAEAILKRTSEVTESDIQTYYARASTVLPHLFVLPVDEAEAAFDITRSVVRYLVLTDPALVQRSSRNSFASVSRSARR